MCVSKWFGGGGGGINFQQQMENTLATQQLQIAQQQQAQAAAAIAASKGDTESSRVAAEAALRKANLSQGFASTLFGGGQQAPANVAYKALFGT